MHKLEQLILLGVRQAGSYQPEDVLPRIEEVLTIPQYRKIRSFLTWVCENNRKFGHGNISAVIEEYKEFKR